MSRRDDLAALDLADTRVIIVRDEPVNGILKALLERRKLELFVVLARLTDEPEQLFIRRRLAELPVRLGRVELVRNPRSACHDGRVETTTLTLTSPVKPYAFTICSAT